MSDDHAHRRRRRIPHLQKPGPLPPRRLAVWRSTQQSDRQVVAVLLQGFDETAGDAASDEAIQWGARGFAQLHRFKNRVVRRRWHLTLVRILERLSE